MSDDTERTLDPTDQRREQFRKDGRFAKARDATGLAATVAVLGVVAGTSGRLVDETRNLFMRTLGDLGALERTGPMDVIGSAARACAMLAAPATFAAVFAAIAIGLAQSGFRQYGELLGPKMSRLDPRSAIGRLFSPKRAGLEAAVSLLRIGLVGAVAWRAFDAELPTLVSLSRVPLSGAMPAASSAMGRVLWTSLGALLLVTLADYAQSFFTLSKEMKMTRKERTDESKAQDGDPKAKARMRARARAVAKRRALSSVKTADVIVTNPTHVAVALRYSAKDPAPVVVAKGHDEVALRIRAEARKHGIPILENRRLARALDAEVQVGRAIPGAHFAAVARVLAFVYRLGRAASKKGRPHIERGTRRA